jgi:hypothetical protein
MIKPTTIFVPNVQETYITLTSADFTRYGFNMEMVWHLWKWHSWKDVHIANVSERTLISAITADKKNEVDFNTIIPVKIKETATINSLVLYSTSVFTNGTSLDDTEALNGPVLIPIPTREVKEGDVVNVRVNYKFGWGFKTLKAEIID